MPRHLGRLVTFIPVLTLLPTGMGSIALADRVRMKNDLIYQGSVHRDETIVSVSDGLKRTFVRDSKIAETVTDPGLRALETFELEQPLEIRAGTGLPTYILRAKAAPWDEYGQRTLSYLNSKQRAQTLTQAIVEINPRLVKIRGVTAPWASSLALGQVPRSVILGLLARVDQMNENERRRVCQFLIQAEWYAEAKAELDRLAADFPDAAEGARNARQAVLSLEAAQVLNAIDRCVRAQQPRAALSRLRAFPTEEVPADLLTEVRERLRQHEQRDQTDRRISRALAETVAALPEERRAPWSDHVVEVLQVALDAPEVARSRLEAFARAGDDPQTGGDARAALAFSGWVVGSERAVPHLDAALRLWEARDLVQAYLASRPEEDRSPLLSQLRTLSWDEGASEEARRLDPDLVTRLVRLMPPPRASALDVRPGEARILRILDDPNPTPTEYGVLLPPEYHPLRSYPTVVALHDGKGPLDALEFWGREAARRGFIVIAPEFVLPGPTTDYRYSTSEHAAVILSLRDARKRFAIDADRTFLVGQLLGGNMAWDLALAHPDLFAGAAILNGLPAKYIPVTRNHAKTVPIYSVLGELAPGAGDIYFTFAKEQITKNYEFTHVEYQKRGLEELPEEVGPVYDWIEAWRRTTPTSFKCNSCRTCDDRFYGAVIQEFAEGRTIEPEAVDPLGRNLPKPATIELSSSSLANLVHYKIDGIRRLDIWVGPDLIDFSRRMEVRVNGKSAFKGLPRLDLEPLLEDLRVRADRQQTYWMKVSVGR